MKRKPLLWAAAAAMLACSACTDATPGGSGALDADSGSESAGSGGGTGETAAATSFSGGELSLIAYDSCSALLSDLIERGLDQVGPYGFTSGGWPPVFPASDDTMADDSADVAESAATTQAASGGDGEFSGTNNQVVGVDELDLVKTDGEILVLAANNALQVIDITDRTPVKVGDITMGDESWVSGLFLLSDRRALVVASTWATAPLDDPEASTESGVSLTELLEVDLDNLKVVSTTQLEGDYVSARQIGDTVRVVMAARPERLEFLYPSGPSSEDAALQANQEVVRNSEISDWLPHYRTVVDGQASEANQITDCSNVHLPPQQSGMSTASVLTLNTAGGVDLVDAVTVLTDSSTVYSATDRMVIATPNFPTFGPFDEAVDDTEPDLGLHTFDITDPSRTSYVASGMIEGYLLNQFSLDVYDGRLRVAVTSGSPWGSGPESSSSVVVLEESGSDLVETGRVDGLGKTETIHSVRFMGDTAYVVTFRQTDPLYVIDLSDPNNPEVAGELKIPGFSRYLHPVGDDLLVGVGQDATDEGQTTGVQVSVFDVSDPANPVRVSQESLGGRDSHSTVEWDHRAFQFWAPTRVALVPVTQWNVDAGEDEGGPDGSSAVVALTVGDDGSLTEQGRVAVAAISECWEDHYEDSGEVVEQCYSYPDEVQRSVVANDTIYAIGWQTLTAANLNDFETIGQLELTRFEN